MKNLLYILLLIFLVIKLVGQVFLIDMGFNTHNDEAYFLMKLGDAYNGIIDGSSQWNLIAIKIFPYLNLTDKLQAYTASFLLCIIDCILIIGATMVLSPNRSKMWLPIIVFTMVLYGGFGDFTYVNLMVLFLICSLTLFLFMLKTKHQVLRLLFAVGTGISSALAILTILPGGLLVLAAYALTLLVLYWKEWKNLIIAYIGGVLGIGLGILLVHFYVADVSSIYEAMKVTAATITQNGRGYDPYTFMVHIYIVLRDWGLTIMIIGSLYFLSVRVQAKYKQLALPMAILWIGVLLTYSYFWRKLHSTPALICSIAILVPWFVQLKDDLQPLKINWKQQILYVFLLLFPLIASLGTNLPLGLRMGAFVFAWIFLYFIYLQPKLQTNKLHNEFGNVLLVLSLLAWLVPAIELVNPVMKKIKGEYAYFQPDYKSPIADVKLTRQQVEYFYRVDSILETLHFSKEKSTILAFDEDRATCYALCCQSAILPYEPGDLISNPAYHIQPDFLLMADWEKDYCIKPHSDILSIWKLEEVYDTINVGSPQCEPGMDWPRKLYFKRTQKE